MKLLKEYINEIIKETKLGSKRLRIFDFDDTLVRTDCRVHVTTASGETFDLTPGEFSVYDKMPGDTFDYGDFNKLINPRLIGWTNHILRKVHAHHGPAGIVILSARSYKEPIREFMQQAGMPDVEVVVLDTALPEAKAQWIQARIDRDHLEMVEFYDDSYKNIAAVEALRPANPSVSIVTRLVTHSG